VKLYLDANAIIYLIEGTPQFKQAVRNRIAALDLKHGDLLLTSRLSVLECRVKPLRDGRNDLLSAYDAFLSQNFVRIVDVSAAVIDQATSLRARYRFKTPDSIHLASGIEEHVDQFLTADQALSRCTEIAVVLV